MTEPYPRLYVVQDGTERLHRPTQPKGMKHPYNATNLESIGAIGVRHGMWDSFRVERDAFDTLHHQPRI